MMHQHPFLLDPSLSQNVSFQDQSEAYQMTSYNSPGSYHSPGYPSTTPSRGSTNSPPGSASLDPSSHLLPNATHTFYYNSCEGEPQNATYYTIPHSTEGRPQFTPEASNNFNIATQVSSDLSTNFQPLGPGHQGTTLGTATLYGDNYGEGSIQYHNHGLLSAAASNTPSNFEGSSFQEATVLTSNDQELTPFSSGLAPTSSCGFGRTKAPPLPKKSSSDSLMGCAPIDNRAQSVPAAQPRQENGTMTYTLVQTPINPQPFQYLTAVTPTGQPATPKTQPQLVNLTPVYAQPVQHVQPVQYINLNGTLVPVQPSPPQFCVANSGNGIFAPQPIQLRSQFGSPSPGPMMRPTCYGGRSSSASPPYGCYSRSSSANRRSPMRKNGGKSRQNNGKQDIPAVESFHPEGGEFTAAQLLSAVDAVKPKGLPCPSMLYYGNPEGLYVDAKLTPWKQPKVLGIGEFSEETAHYAFPLVSTAYDPMRKHDGLMGRRYEHGENIPKDADSIRIVSLSNMHELHALCTGIIPDGDLLIFAGDMVNATGPNIDEGLIFTEATREAMFRDFVGTFLKPLVSRFKLGVYVTLGNHDVWAEANLPLARRIISDAGATLLVDETTTLSNGMTMFMSPMSIFRGRDSSAFQVVRTGTPGHAKVRKLANCPRRTDAAYIRTKFPKRHVDILVTHGTPAGSKVGFSARWQSSLELKNWVNRHKPRVHIFGDSSSNYGAELVPHQTGRGRGRARARPENNGPTTYTLNVNSSLAHTSRYAIIAQGIRRAPAVVDLAIEAPATTTPLEPQVAASSYQVRARSFPRLGNKSESPDSVDRKPQTSTAHSAPSAHSTNSWKAVLLSQQKVTSTNATTGVGMRQQETRSRRSIVTRTAPLR